MILSPVSDADLDRAFAALADPVRRAIIARLSRGAGDGQRARRTVRDHQAGRLQAHPGARAGRASSPGPATPSAARSTSTPPRSRP